MVWKGGFTKILNHKILIVFHQVEPQDVGVWVDYWFLLVFGGIPWQCYYQRVLSSKTANRAMFLSYGGAAIALIMTGEYLKIQQQMINYLLQARLSCLEQ